MEILDEIDIKIDKDDVLHRADGVKPKIDDVLNEMVEEGHRLIEPRILYTYYKITDRGRKRLILENGSVLKSPILADRLRCSEEVAAYVSTIGPRLEARVTDHFSKGEYLKGWILDNVGTNALRKTNQYLYNVVKAKMGASPLSRFSPGHNYWDISQQRILFNILPAEKIGVELTEHLMMKPKKSTSGIIGSTEKKFTSCQICQLRERCEWRDNESPPMG